MTPWDENALGYYVTCTLSVQARGRTFLGKERLNSQ